MSSHGGDVTMDYFLIGFIGIDMNLLDQICYAIQILYMYLNAQAKDQVVIFWQAAIERLHIRDE